MKVDGETVRYGQIEREFVFGWWFIWRRSAGAEFPQISVILRMNDAGLKKFVEKQEAEMER